MGKLIFENSAYTYVAQDQKTVLLSCRNYLANRSRIPLHTMADQADGILTIPALIENLQKQHPALSEGTPEAPFAAEHLLMQLLVISRLMESPLPVRVCEFGCGCGVMSYYLSVLLGLFNEASSLCCVTDVMGDDSQTPWLDRIALIQNPPKLSWLASDYDSVPLAPGYFDLVILDGGSDLGPVHATIKEAENLTGKNGTILCYCRHYPALESSFRQAFPHAQTYTLQNDVSIMAAGRGEEPKSADRKHDVQAFIHEARKYIDTRQNPDTIRLYVKKSDQLLDEAVSENALKQKQQLIRLKEDLLNALVENRRLEKP